MRTSLVRDVVVVALGFTTSSERLRMGEPYGPARRRPYARPVPAVPPPAHDAAHGAGAAGPPWTVRAAVALALTQAAGAAAFAVRFLVDVLPFEEPRLMRAGFAIGVVVLVAGAAAALVAAARALHRLRPWPRSLLVVAQIMALAIGVPMAQGGDRVGWAIGATALVGLVLLLHPTTTSALGHAEHGPRPG